MGKVAGLCLIGLVEVYRWLISPVLPQACRYEPTCSAYAGEAVRLHGPLRGLALATWRILRCHPWGDSGYDPVPVPRTSACRHSAEPDARDPGYRPLESDAVMSPER